MAGPRACHNPLFLSSKDESTEGASIKGSGTSIPTLTAFRVFTFILALAPAAGLLDRYTDKNLQEVTKLAQKLFIQS